MPLLLSYIIFSPLFILSFYHFELAAYIGAVAACGIILFSSYIIWSNSKLKPPKGIKLSIAEEKIFKKYATWVVFPAVNTFLIALVHPLWICSILFGALSIPDFNWLFLALFFTIFVLSQIIIARLSPEFLKKNADRGVKNQQTEFLTFQSMFTKYNLYNEEEENYD